MTDFKPNRTVPRFFAEGYALYEGRDIFDNWDEAIKLLQAGTQGFREKIGFKPNSPLWAIDEHEQWAKMLENV